MKACYDKVTGIYLDNEQSWVGEPEWPAGAVVLEAGRRPWCQKIESGELVEDEEKVTARQVLDAGRKEARVRGKKIRDEVYRLAEQSLIDKGEL